MNSWIEFSQDLFNPGSGGGPGGGGGGATRFYLPSSGAAPAAPAYSSGWHRTVAAFRTNLVTAATQTPNTKRPVSHTTAVAPEWHLMGQFISAPLAAQTISGTVKGQVRGRNNNDNYQGTLALRAFVVSGDGTSVRGVLVENTAATQSGVPPVFQGSSSTSRNRAFRTGAGDAAIPVTPLTIQAGDRLVVEVGVRDHSEGTSASATVVFGDNHADDLLEGDSSSSTALNPCLEFSHDFFGTGGGGLPSGWSHADIGAVGVAGSASHSGATFTVAGAGSDIWGTSDAFHYVYRQMTGDGQIVARVPSVAYVHHWTRRA